MRQAHPAPVQRRESPGHGGASGVSEVIGAVLLISLVVTAVAIVAVVINSQAKPQNIPDVSFMIGTDNKIPPSLYLTHNGGDALSLGSFSVIVDGTDRPYSLVGGGNQWSLGKNLQVPLAVGEHPNSVVLIYNATGTGSSVIGSVSANISVPSVTIAPEIIVPPSACVNISDPQVVVNVILGNVSIIGDAMNQSPSTVGPVIANVVGANSITFFRESKTSIDQYTYLYLNITRQGSIITYGTTTPKSLEVGDNIVVTLTKSTPGSWKVFGLGDQIWEFSAPDSAKVVDIGWKHKSNGTWTNTTSTQLFHTWITGYQDIGSTMTLRTNQNGYYTALSINGTMLINGVDSHTVVIRNIRPVGVGLFVLEYDPSSDSMYFVGNAQSVSVT